MFYTEIESKYFILDEDLKVLNIIEANSEDENLLAIASFFCSALSTNCFVFLFIAYIFRVLIMGKGAPPNRGNAPYTRTAYH